MEMLDGSNLHDDLEHARARHLRTNGRGIGRAAASNAPLLIGGTACARLHAFSGNGARQVMASGWVGAATERVSACALGVVPWSGQRASPPTS